jgi:hypothetical protein
MGTQWVLDGYPKCDMQQNLVKIQGLVWTVSNLGVTTYDLIKWWVFIDKYLFHQSHTLN